MRQGAVGRPRLGRRVRPVTERRADRAALTVRSRNAKGRSRADASLAVGARGADRGVAARIPVDRMDRIDRSRLGELVLKMIC